MKRTRLDMSESDVLRALSGQEIARLESLGCRADDWRDVLVCDPASAAGRRFDPELIRDCQFRGRVHIGKLAQGSIECDGLHVPIGLSRCRFTNCRIGDFVAVHDVHHMEGYSVGDRSVVMNVGEMLATGRPPGRWTVDVMNENGKRVVQAAPGMTPGDAWLWGKLRGDRRLIAGLERLASAERHGLGAARIGDGCSVRSVVAIRDAWLEDGASVVGADRLEQVVVRSLADAPTRIGAGVQLARGVVGRGCRVDGAAIAENFILGDGARLTHGALLAHSVLGDNSTVAACEVRNSLIFPAHEQHHRNSFLIAADVQGQSNVAAGATIGSNHNSRAADGEVQAGRGFWPGLCASVKHFSRFASFTLLAKGDYPAELDVPLPFSLVADESAAGRLVVMPAYWWTHNMYALARNAGKFRARDRRVRKTQNIEFEPLAPDTVEEIFDAVLLLELLAGREKLRSQGRDASKALPAALAAAGRELLSAAGPEMDMQVVGLENSHRPAVILKVRRAYDAYRDMLHYYAVRTLLGFWSDNPKARLATMQRTLAGKARQQDWANVGGQIMRAGDLSRLAADIGSGRLASFAAVHERCDELWAGYRLAKQRHALATLLDVLGVAKLTPRIWRDAMERFVRLQRFVCDQVAQTRAKDFGNPFRCITFADKAERSVVMGSSADDAFIRQTRQETQELEKLAAAVKRRG